MKNFKSFIFIIFFFSLSNTFVFASIPPYINKSNQITDGLYKIQNYNSATPESVLVLNSFDPNYNTNGQTPLNSILSSSALLVFDVATLKASSGVFGISSVSDAYRGGSKVDDVAGGIEKEAVAVLKIDSNQLGKKLGKHVEDFGGSASNAADRQLVINRIQEIGNNPDKIISGSFRGQGVEGNIGNVLFRIKGNDVVVTKPDGTFVTILKDGVTKNTFVKNALNGVK